MQQAHGDQNVQIHHVTGSTITITYQGATRALPLEPPLVPVPRTVRSPARLLRARTGVVPFTARQELRRSLQDWCWSGEPWAAHVIGGRGGSGKTRLATQLCLDVQRPDWLAGLLAATADQGALDALAEVPTARFVVVDYAETRGEQLAYLLPALAHLATEQHPVRVLLLVRTAPRRSGDWTETLQGHSDLLDALVEDMDVQLLEGDACLTMDERRSLFDATVRALTEHLGGRVAPPAPGDLAGPLFCDPLIVVVAAYVALQGAAALPPDRAGLLEELLRHEDRYWQRTAGALGMDETLRRRVVAIAALAGSSTEAEAVEMLRLVPDLVDSSVERRCGIARWAARLYPGTSWWNPIEPDLLCEHLVASTLAEVPGALAGVLAGRPAGAVTPTLELLRRAAVDHEDLAASLRPVLSGRLTDLGALAVAQIAEQVELDAMLAPGLLVTSLERLMSTVPADGAALAEMLAILPRRRDLALSSLAATAGRQLVDRLRARVRDDAETLPDLARALNDLSAFLFTVGERSEALATIAEAVSILRALAAVDAAQHLPDLARSLSNRAVYLQDVGRAAEALRFADEGVEIRRELAGADAALLPGLARSLSNRAVSLHALGFPEEALASEDEAVELLRQLSITDEALVPVLAAALSNLAKWLGALERWDEAVTAAEEAVELLRAAAATSPTAFVPDLAKSLTNLAVALGEVGRTDEALPLTEVVVATYRRLGEASPSTYLGDLSRALHDRSLLLARADRLEDAVVAIDEAAELRRRLVETRPLVFLVHLASTLVARQRMLERLGRTADAAASAAEAEGCLGELLGALEGEGFYPDQPDAATTASISVSSRSSEK